MKGNTVKKSLAALAATALLSGGVFFGFAAPAVATEQEIPTCVPAEAYDETVTDAEAYDTVHPAVAETFSTVHHEATYQRYSWTGGPTDDAPTELPPSAHWQANTTNYDGAGHGSDPIGYAFHNSANGAGDWFFWAGAAAYDTQEGNGDGVEAWTEHFPAVTHVVHHDAIVCDEDPEDPSYVLVAWQLPGDVNEPIWPGQTLVNHIATAGTSLDLFDEELTGTCFDYQIDRYYDSEITDALLEGGVLNGPNNPEEDLAYVGEGNPWKYIDNDNDCTPDVTTYQPSCTTVDSGYVIEGDGVISVPGEWASNTIAVPFSGTLADIGTVLDIDATPLQYVGLHIHTAEGTIVFEEEASYNGQLWSNSAWAGVNAGLGYAALGSIEEYIHLNGDVVVTGIDLLYTSPEASSTTVDSFVIGCTSYTFEPAVIEEPPVVTPPVVTPPTVVAPPVVSAAVVAAVPTEVLASTGYSSLQNLLFIVGGLVGIGTAILLIAAIRRRTDKPEVE